MKRILISTLMSSLLLLSFSCGTGSGDSNTTTSNNSENTTKTEATETQPDAEAGLEMKEKPIVVKETPITASAAMPVDQSSIEEGDPLKNRPHSTEGDCIYIDFIGLAKIKSITDAPAEGENCDNAKLVEFSFGLIDQGDIKNYKYTLFKDDSQFLTISGGLNPSSAWIERMGLEEELVLTCHRKELFQGKCGPVIYIFPELDTNPKEKCK